MGRDGSFQVYVLGAILFVELATHKRMQVQVEGLNGPVEFFQITLEGLGLVPGSPVFSSVCKPCNTRKMLMFLFFPWVFMSS